MYFLFANSNLALQKCACWSYGSSSVGSVSVQFRLRPLFLCASSPGSGYSRSESSRPPPWSRGGVGRQKLQTHACSLIFTEFLNFRALGPLGHLIFASSGAHPRHGYSVFVFFPIGKKPAEAWFNLEVCRHARMKRMHTLLSGMIYGFTNPRWRMIADLLL